MLETWLNIFFCLLAASKTVFKRYEKILYDVNNTENHENNKNCTISSVSQKLYESCYLWLLDIKIIYIYILGHSDNKTNKQNKWT